MNEFPPGTYEYNIENDQYTKVDDVHPIVLYKGATHPPGERTLEYVPDEDGKSYIFASDSPSGPLSYTKEYYKGGRDDPFDGILYSLHVTPKTVVHVPDAGDDYKLEHAINNKAKESGFDVIYQYGGIGLEVVVRDPSTIEIGEVHKIDWQNHTMQQVHKNPSIPVGTQLDEQTFIDHYLIAYELDMTDTIIQRIKMLRDKLNRRNQKSNLDTVKDAVGEYNQAQHDREETRAPNNSSYIDSKISSPSYRNKQGRGKLR